jgi:ribosomal protein S3
VIGIKVWVFKGEILAKNEQPLLGAIGAPPIEPEPPAPRKRVSLREEQEQDVLQPARRKYRKEQKGRNKGVATRGNKVSLASTA